MFARGRTIRNLLKPKRKLSSINNDINVLARHFENLMTDNGRLNSEQVESNSGVVDKYRCNRDMEMEMETAIDGNIRILKGKCVPGIDDVTAEHMLPALLHCVNEYKQYNA